MNERSRAIERLRLLHIRHMNGPNAAGYSDIRDSAVAIVCDLLAELGCSDVGERFREILEAPVEAE